MGGGLLANMDTRMEPMDFSNFGYEGKQMSMPIRIFVYHASACMHPRTMYLKIIAAAKRNIVYIMASHAF